MIAQIRITGDKQTIANIKKLGDSITKLRPEMMQIGSEVKKYYGGQVFASQGGALGKKWRRLDRTYAKRKAKKYPGRGPLIRTGKMQKGFIMSTTEKSVTIENTAPYFKYHQSSAPRKFMPYRPMMDIDDHVKDIISTVIERGIIKRIEASQ